MKPPMGLRHVFVYGTLRLGEERDINRLQPAPRRVGCAVVRGVMYQLDSYPGVLLSGAGLVHGEVYEISAELERQLDAIEEVWPQPSGEYIKREIQVSLEGVAGQLEQALCLFYEIAPERVLGKTVIASGDWVRHRVDSVA